MSIRRLAYRLSAPVFLTGLLIMSLLGGCRQSLDPALVAADSKMEEHPDSALMMLEKYRLTPNSKSADSAYFALLLTHARYKNFIDETDDSLISGATDWFLKHGDGEKASRALFLQGMIQMNANRLGDAAVSFRKGLDIAHEGQHYMWEGQCARGLVVLYSQIYDGSSQLEYAKKSYSAFENANDKAWSEYAKLNVARACNNNGLYREADSIVSEIIAYCENAGKPDFLAEAYQLKGLSLYALGNFEQSLRNYAKAFELDSSILTVGDRRNINIASAEISQQTGLEGLNLPKDTLREMCSDAFVVLARNKQYREAYECLERYKNEQDSVLSLIIKNDIAGSLSQYEEIKKTLDNERVQNERMSYWIVILVILVVACAVLWRYREGMHKEKFLRMKTEADLESLRSDFRNQLENAEETSEKTVGIKATVISEEFMRIIRQQYSETNKLCDDYYQGIKSEREKLASKIKMIVNELTGNEGIEKIGKYVDEQSGGIYSSFTRDFFNLTEDDKRLFLYQMLGFSSRTIAVIIGYEPKTVYNRRARLKAKIENSDVENKEIYLRVIQKKIQ